MRFVRLGSAVLAGTMAVAVASAGGAGAASSKTGSSGVPKLESTATAAEACEVIFGTDAFDKAPSEGEVAPGEAVSVDVTWGGGFKKGSTVEVVGCTAVDGDFSEGLSTRIRKVKNDGLFVHEFTVPNNADKGAVLCQRAIVIGESATGSPKAERLDADCFTVAAAAAQPAEETSAPAESKAANTDEAAAKAKNASKADKEESAAPAAKTGASAAPAAETHGTPDAAKKKAAGATVAGETEARADAAAPSALARTGSAEGPLAAAAGLLFILGGLAVAFGRPLRGVLR